MTQALLITPDELPRYATTADFMQKFEVRSLLITITTGGSLGTMAFAWQRIDDPNQSNPIPSELGATYSKRLPDPGFGMLTFAAGNYVLNTTYRVGADGTVTPGPGAIAGLTAVRIDPATDICWSVTSDTATWVQPRLVPPIITAGAGLKRLMAALAVARLKLREGATSVGAGVGDDNLKSEARKAEDDIRAYGRADNRPPDVVDSSPTGSGAGIPLMPQSRSPRGFGDFT